MSGITLEIDIDKSSSRCNAMLCPKQRDYRHEMLVDI